ncbi:MAG: N-acetylneuraminic acid synthase [Alphaproteobacteria bacterium]|nr:N-acetylneuraminic acid synthase [Alphaproteobacteria bacterium]
MACLFIAEVSSNHDRDLDRAFAFIDKAAEIGCDAVKFQLFKIDEMFAPEILAKSAKHRARKEWELPVSFLGPIAQRCRERAVQFICTPFYLKAVAELSPHVDAFKVASYELMWDALLEACAKTGKPVILSCGMATLPEVHHAAGVLRRSGAKDVTLLHTVSAYPTPIEEANLAAMKTIAEATGFPCGWSDHTVSPGVILRAVGRWQAPMVEFHLDLDRNGAEYAAGHCWLPEQMAPVIAMVRDGERADGDGLKRALPSELADRDWRADPADGLRPLKHIRRTYRGEAA